MTQGLFFAPLRPAAIRHERYNAHRSALCHQQAGRARHPEGHALRRSAIQAGSALSTAFQAGIVTWVAFWALYGQGFSAANLYNVGSFSLAYMSVILIEPLVDLAVLAAAKSLRKYADGPVFVGRLYRAA